MKRLQAALNGEDSGDIFLRFSPTEVGLFKFAPFSSCDVERAFSSFNYVFSDRRRRLLLPNMASLLAIHFNRG